MDDQEVKYDLHSIMHYGNSAFAKSNDLQTMVPLRNPNGSIGGKEKLSEKDIIICGLQSTIVLCEASCKK